MLNQFLSHANWLALIVAAIVYFALGSLWFSVLFGKQWMALNNIPEPTPQAKEEMKKMMLGMMIKTLIMALVLSVSIGILAMALGLTNYMAGIKLGLLLSAIGAIPLVMSEGPGRYRTLDRVTRSFSSWRTSRRMLEAWRKSNSPETELIKPISQPA